MYNVKSVPKIKIKEVFKNDIDIIKNKDSYMLYRQGKKEHALNTITNKEVKELYSSYDLGYGNILKSGLGFGVLPLWLSKKDTVKSIKIIEISQSVVDIFLENNDLPQNVTIEIGDIEDYKTNEKYDCILLDHYENAPVQWRLRSIKNIAKNVPNHDILWIWSMEDLYLKTCYNTEPYRENTSIIQQTDFSDKWDYFKNNIIEVKTVPDVQNKINEYIYTYADFLNSKYTKQS